MGGRSRGRNRTGREDWCNYNASANLLQSCRGQGQEDQVVSSTRLPWTNPAAPMFFASTAPASNIFKYQGQELPVLTITAYPNRTAESSSSGPLSQAWYRWKYRRAFIRGEPMGIARRFSCKGEFCRTQGCSAAGATSASAAGHLPPLLQVDSCSKSQAGYKMIYQRHLLLSQCHGHFSMKNSTCSCWQIKSECHDGDGRLLCLKLHQKCQDLRVREEPWHFWKGRGKYKWNSDFHCTNKALGKQRWTKFSTMCHHVTSRESLFWLAPYFRWQL